MTFVLDHLELSVCDLERSTNFYRSALLPLGYSLHVANTLRGFGVTPKTLDFWLREGTPSTPSPHFAFNCSTRSTVASAFELALNAGGIDAGGPTLLPHIHPHYYAAFVRDPDGHKVEFVCHSDDAEHLRTEV